MKTTVFRMDWLVPVLGIVVVGGAYCFIRSYLGYEQDLRSANQTIAICDRLLEDCNLTRSLVQAQNDGCAATSRGLDAWLSADMANVKADATSADPRTQRVVEACVDYLDRRRSENSAMGAGLPAPQTTPQIAAQSVPTQNLAGASGGK